MLFNFELNLSLLVLANLINYKLLDILFNFNLLIIPLTYYDLISGKV